MPDYSSRIVPDNWCRDLDDDERQRAWNRHRLAMIAYDHHYKLDPTVKLEWELQEDQEIELEDRIEELELALIEIHNECKEVMDELKDPTIEWIIRFTKEVVEGKSDEQEDPDPSNT